MNYEKTLIFRWFDCWRRCPQRLRANGVSNFWTGTAWTSSTAWTYSKLPPGRTPAVASGSGILFPWTFSPNALWPATFCSCVSDPSIGDSTSPVEQQPPQPPPPSRAVESHWSTISGPERTGSTVLQLRSCRSFYKSNDIYQPEK